MTNTKTFKNYLIPAVFFIAGIFLFSCENDLDAIQKVTYDPKSPDDVTHNLKVLYNDSGYPQIKIFAKLAETYSKPEHLTKLKNGLQNFRALWDS